MPSNARNLANLLGTGQSTISAEKLGSDVPPGTEDYSSIDSLGVGTTIGETAFVEGSNRLYLWNGSGWYNIALINTTPTWDSGGQPAGAYELSADSPQTATTITLAALDPEGFPVSYNYITGGSMDSIATISQDSSVFTITPKTSTQAPNGGTGSITFRATDGINILPQVSSFTLNFITAIENSKYTIMHVNAIAASDNNNITDSSTNNLTTTVNGTTSASTFSPYRGGGYSTSFYSQNVSRLDIASMPAIGSGDCSIECWVKINSQAWNGIISRGAYVSSGTFSLSTRSGDSEITLVWNGSIYTTSGANININEWNWIQVVRSSGTITIYVNGISRKSVSNSANISSTSNYIIGRVDTFDYFGGQIRDLRISTSARSSSDGLAKLEVDSDTTFLSCHLPYRAYSTPSVVSNSYSNNPSSTTINSFSPYDYEEYSATDNGGSIFVDNLSSSTDSVSCTLGSAIGTGDFSISGWFYPPEIHGSGNKRIWTLGGNNNVNGLGLLFQTNGEIRLDFPGNTTSFGGNGGSIVNRWQHFCVRRISGTATLHLDGVQKWTQSNNTINLSATNLEVGRDTSGLYGSHGYISDFKISTSNLEGTTVPTEPTSSTGALVHIKGTDASIVDTAQGTHIECVGSAAGTSSPAKFPGTYSLSLPGFGHWMPSPMESVKLSGTEDWTVEAWVYPTQRQSYSVVMSCGSSFALALGMVSGNFHVYNNSAGGFTDTDVNYGTYDIAANQWTHLAATRVNGNWYCYVDGTLRYQKTGGSWQSHVMNETTQYTIGAVDGFSSYSGNERWYGNVQDVRITKGLARYTANFTPPTEPLEG